MSDSKAFSAPAAGASNGDEPCLAIRCRSVTKAYGTGYARVTALRGVDLDVKCGELLLLVGPSGCGKTTLISVIAGILDRDGGECRVFGSDFQELPAGERTRARGRQVGFVFQAFNLLPTLNAAENVAVPLLIAGVARRQALARARDALAQVGLAERASALPAQLSGGQQQRVAIARSLVHEPRLIVCDEPTSSLDHANGEKVMEIMRAHALGPERALVIVTHDARIFHYADRIAEMDDGRITNVKNPPAAAG
ncbi:MAG: ABC transporter ATP-binding protein [Planctomycetes bacterium]|nr:ABC transporter ATP-binding protein [Planctomycetota bacterium]